MEDLLKIKLKEAEESVFMKQQEVAAAERNLATKKFELKLLGHWLMDLEELAAALSK